jgi:hypothetical protein
MRVRADTSQASAASRSLNSHLKEVEGTSAKAATAKGGGLFGGVKSAISSNLGKVKSELADGLKTGAGFAVANGAMNLLGDAMGGVADSAIGLNARLEQSQIAFGVTLHSGTAAKARCMSTAHQST